MADSAGMTAEAPGPLQDREHPALRRLDTWFELRERGSTHRTEFIGGTTTLGILLHTGGELLAKRRVSPILVVFSGFFILYFLHGTI